MINLEKAWEIGVITENVNRVFIKDLYRESDIFYTVDRFDDNLQFAVAVADYIVINMIIWHKISVLFEVEKIIERMKGHEKVI